MKTNKYKWIIIILTSYILTQSNLYAQLNIPCSVISSGGSLISGSNYQINGTLGQSFIGNISSSQNINLIGFWYTAEGFVTDIQEGQNPLPTEYFLAQNYPNPFNPSTKITYSIQERSNVSIKVFDLLGSEVEELVKGEIEAGTYDINFNASNLPSGIYFYRLQAGDFVQTRKMILLK
jgi:hypothetical protein